MKKDILLIIPSENTEPNYKYNFPLGVPYISSILKEKGYQVDCLNLHHTTGDIDEVLSKHIKDKKYKFVGIGGTALDYRAINRVIKFFKGIEDRPKIIIGGLIITAEPKIVFDLLNPDYAVIGEGEVTIIELLKSLKNKRSLNLVKGIMFKNDLGESVYTGTREPIEDLDKLPFPDLEGFGIKEKMENAHCNDIEVAQIFNNPIIYPMIGSRGCPFNCTFCYHYNKHKQRSIKNMVEEIRMAVKKYKINILLLHDDCISLKKERLEELCNNMKKIRDEISWDFRWSIQLTVLGVNKQMLNMLRDSGVRIINYGFESFNKEVLKSMRKPITPRMIEKAFFETLECGIGATGNFIFGDKEETLESAEETLNWWKKHAKSQVALDFIHPYPGSEIYYHCIKKGIIKDKSDFIKNKVGTRPIYNMSNHINDYEFNRLRRKIYDCIRDYTIRVIPKSVKKVKRNNYNVTVECPFCKEEMIYKNCLIKNIVTLDSLTFRCRNCNHSFLVVSWIKNLAYTYYPIARKIRDIHLKFREIRRRLTFFMDSIKISERQNTKDEKGDGK